VQEGPAQADRLRSERLRRPRLREGNASHGLDILDSLAAGETPDEIIRSFPSVSLDDVRATIAHAAELVRVTRVEARVLVTLDTDFADIRDLPPASHPGIVVFRLERQSRRPILSVTRRWIPLLRSEEASHRLWIVDETRLRIHE
jgi:predicted nuclease of predicted toxin-antitoxin system